MNMKFAERIRELRLEKNLRQKDIARHMKVTDATVTRWETGSIEPNYETLAKLALFFGESTDYLLGLTD